MGTGPQNIVVGDNFGTELPDTAQDEKGLVEEKNMAKFSKSTEFQKLKAHLEGRITHYQTYLPDGRPLTEVDLGRLGEQWMVANAVITEFRAVLQAYEYAREVVEEKYGKN